MQRSGERYRVVIYKIIAQITGIGNSVILSS